MGHHINNIGEFQNDKLPILKPDRITLNFRNPASHSALAALAENYKWIDPGLSEDIRTRLLTVIHHPDFIRKAAENAEKTLPIMMELIDSVIPNKTDHLIGFVEAILHGNDEHKAWLREAAIDYNKGWTVKRPRG